MTITNDLQDMQGRIAVDVAGAKLGKIGRLYVDSRTGEPLWVTISTGMFGTKQNFAPLYGCQSDGDNLRLAVTKDMVEGAPSIDAAGRIGDDDSEALFAYYEGYAGGSAQGAPAGYEAQGLAGHEAQGYAGGAATSGGDIDDPDTSR